MFDMAEAGSTAKLGLALTFPISKHLDHSTAPSSLEILHSAVKPVHYFCSETIIGRFVCASVVTKKLSIAIVTVGFFIITAAEAEILPPIIETVIVIPKSARPGNVHHVIIKAVKREVKMS